MDTEEKEETAEAAESSSEEKEKKENSFSKFWKKTKQSVNDSILENKIESAFDKAHDSYSVYTRGQLISHTINGSFVDGKIVVFGEVEVKPYSVIIDKADKAVYAISTESTTVKATVDGTEYERVGTSITVDESVEEVKVVKAGDRYFIYKGND